MPVVVKWGMKWMVRAIAILAGLYGLYLIKSALGINLFENYHAIDILKMPVRAIADQVRTLGA